MRKAGLATGAALFLAFVSGAWADTDFQLKNMNSTLVAQLKQAWQAAGKGSSNHEAAVIIVQQPDSSYQAILVFDQEGFQTIRLEVPPHAVAIFHTHPNHAGGEPSLADRRNSDLLSIPNFTLTDRGVWVYDPHTRRTSRIHYKLAWLDAKNWQELEMPR